MVPGSASLGIVLPTMRRTVAIASGPSRATAATGPEVMNSTRPGVEVLARRGPRNAARRASRDTSSMRSPTSFRPFRSKRPTISPTSPRWTPSGLIRTSVRSMRKSAPCGWSGACSAVEGDGGIRLAAGGAQEVAVE